VLSLLYRILLLINFILLKFSLEVRKSSSWPYYYVHHYDALAVKGKNKVFTLPIDKIVSPHFFSYGQEGWHYYTELLRELNHSSSLLYGTSVLKRYYDLFQPNTVAEILFFDEPENAPRQLQDMPALLIRDFWQLDGSIDEVKSHLISEETQLFGPISEMYGEEQFIRCDNAYRLLKKHGYLPDRFEDGYIGGIFIFHNGDYRFVASAGKHRLGALSVLGYSEIMAHCPYKIKVLDSQNLQNWPTVRSGMFSENDMRRILDKCFSQNGKTFALNYGLLSRASEKIEDVHSKPE
jgi:hypothetical protein